MYQILDKAREVTAVETYCKNLESTRDRLVSIAQLVEEVAGREVKKSSLICQKMCGSIKAALRRWPQL
jgi:hypothetical protein